MKISVYTPPANFTLGHGYSNAAMGIITSLQKIGHEVPFDDASAKVQINFGQPPYCVDYYRKDQHSIAYFPWESTEIPEDWYDCLSEADEIWTTSDWCFNTFKDLGLNVTTVWPHGIDHKWRPVKRANRDGKVTFLHHGSPATRKGAQQAYDAFKHTFGDSEDVQLIIKAREFCEVRKKVNGVDRPVDDKNVKIMRLFTKEEELIGLYHQVDAMIYNSAGEGYGLIPLQALATGLPTICTESWCHFSDYLGDLTLKSELIDSPWGFEHPGKVYQPDFDDLCEKYQYVYTNIRRLQSEFYRRAIDLHDEYDWETVTEKSVKDLITKFS